MYEKIKQNSVESKNQLNEYVHIYNSGGKGKRVIFAGNSITLHAPKEEIGWYGNCGMAASEENNDYVHILMEKFNKEYGDCAFCICQVASWERAVFDGENCCDMYREARNFNADIIVARFVENCPVSDFNYEVFKKEYTTLIDYFNLSGRAQIIFTSGFWKHPGDEVIAEISAENKGTFVSLGDLGENDEMQALGLFEHKGVSMHPGDKGMAEIANRIWSAVKF